MRTLTNRTGVLIAGLFFASTPAFSCKCSPTGAEPPTAKEEFARVDAVFSGRVVSISDIKIKERGVRVKDGEKTEIDVPLKVIKLQILKSWKGTTGRTVSIEMESGCDIYFEKGKSYLVYAQKIFQKLQKPRTVELSTSMCNRTRPIEKAQEDLRSIAGLKIETGAP